MHSVTSVLLLWRVGCLLDKLLHSTTRQCVTTGSDLGGSSAPSASIQSFASVARRALAKPKPTFPKADLFYPQMYRSLISSFCASRFPGVGGGYTDHRPPAKRPCGQARTGRRRSNVHKPLLERPHTTHMRHRRAMGQPYSWIMFLYDSLLPSCASRGGPLHASRNQNVAGQQSVGGQQAMMLPPKQPPPPHPHASPASRRAPVPP